MFHFCFRTLFYILLFYTEIFSIFVDHSSSSSSSSNNNFFRRLLNYVRSPPYYVEPNTGHACSVSANIIREEADILTVDLYQRLKQSVFAAFTTAYFAIFVPCCFTPVNFKFHNFFLSRIQLCFALNTFLLRLAIFIRRLLVGGRTMFRRIFYVLDYIRGLFISIAILRFIAPIRVSFGCLGKV